jgi:putative transposase
MYRKYTESKAVAAIKKQESGIPVKEICSEFNISYATFYNWKSRYEGLKTYVIEKYHELKNENAELKKMFAELGLENRALKSLLEKRESDAQFDSQAIAPGTN